MREFDRFSWIKTRDGSPTLFHNEEGAAFRSQKGAFTESYHVFVKPALEFARELDTQAMRLLEFGLGPGTNWLLWSLFSHLDPALSQKELQYVAIEKDSSSFEMGFQFWIESCDELPSMISKSCLSEKGSPKYIFPTSFELKTLLESARQNTSIIPSLDQLIEEDSSLNSSQKFDLCFFDPFGYDVNPEAYQSPELQRLKTTLNAKSIALSYACNSKFQKSLKEAGYGLRTPYSGASQLKRERIEFWPA